MSNPIPAENLNTGTTAWIATAAATTQIQAYADKTSYNPGDTVTFFVSTQINGTSYTIKIYRMGYYQGTGACLKFTSPMQIGVAQGYYDAGNQTLNNCPTAFVDGTTHLCEAGWAASYTWAVPNNAVTGAYIAQFVDANGKQHYVDFVIKGNSPADYCIVRPVTTDQAYNDWGGFSLYTSPTVGTKVSFNRPSSRQFGASGLFAYEVAAIKWLESQGYNLSYITSVDLHANPSLLLNYRAFLSNGHDEYWTKEMRDGVEAALAQGVGLGFLSANHCYWQCRLENAHDGTTPNRTVTCYKVEPRNNNLNLDPFYGVDNTRLTCQWRQWPVRRPEYTLIGIMFSAELNSGGNDIANVGWRVDPNASSSYLAGTGLANGSTYGYDLVGYEYDKQFPNSPANLQVIGNTLVTDINGVSDWSNTTIYVAPSGALVFAAGSISWTFALDTYRLITQPGGPPVVIPGMQTLFANILKDLIRGKTAPKISYGAYSALHR